MIAKSAPPASRYIGVRTPCALPGQRIGVMGGSFNPPHEGHLIVANTAMRRCRLDRIWWLVTPGNPLKAHDDLAHLAQREAQIARLARHPRMQITSFETQLETTFTAATLRFLKTRHSATNFVWVMGADNLATFHHWQHWREITTTMPIVVVDRPGWHFKALSSPAARTMANARLPEASAAALSRHAPPAWTYLTTRLSPLSSSDLRSKSTQSMPK